MRFHAVLGFTFSRLILAALLGSAGSAWGFTITFKHTDFALNPAFNSLQQFSFTIDVAGALVPGTYNNPALTGVIYSVQGTLAGTPSGFPAFNLQRTIGGAEFYSQGSSLQFVIAPGASLSDGLQISDLLGPNPVFLLDAREVGTGRYHPPIIRLNADGTGQIQNSNNFGGINPATGQMVNVNYGDEYIVNLAFNPTALTLSVPEPATGISAGLLLLGLLAARRRGGN